MGERQPGLPCALRGLSGFILPSFFFQNAVRQRKVLSYRKPCTLAFHSERHGLSYKRTKVRSVCFCVQLLWQAQLLFRARSCASPRRVLSYRKFMNFITSQWLGISYEIKNPHGGSMGTGMPFGLIPDTVLKLQGFRPRRSPHG